MKNSSRDLDIWMQSISQSFPAGFARGIDAKQQ